MIDKTDNVELKTKWRVFNDRPIAQRCLAGLLLLCSSANAALAESDDAAKPPFVVQMLQKLGPHEEGGGEPKEAGSKDNALQGCPEVIVDGGAADLRSPAGAEASSLRYEIALGRTARECARAGDQFSVKLGVNGSVMLGPAGQAGAYYGNLRIALRRKKDEQLFSSKTLKVGAAVGAGSARGEYSILVDDLTAPLVSANPNDDYEIIIGFAPEGGAQASPGKKRRKSE
ncbi:hypothetical protein [Methylocystis heyeri]|uniref:DUF4402 domain-containing protein n=1 Tax=Methylocystis heyeri TaxID=391905 RepID=A0A6B8KH81_9HYPH|nr:hypothetical protein [Methylocystis heyeri]QGM47706.1 hypothetical protein H2LOC_019625 [Methylocystis heyeri]